MSIDQATLGKRLQEARNNRGTSQEDAAQVLGLPRTAIVHIEAGNRSVSTLELAQLARLYGCPVAEFFKDEGEDEDVLVVLHRVAPEFGEDSELNSKVTQQVAICRVGTELFELLGPAGRSGPPMYNTPAPRHRMEAVEQGSDIARQERQRLGTGNSRISDMADLIASQGIWPSGADLSDEMSGFFLHHRTIGMVILVNLHHSTTRKRFSYAHEYAHALLDRGLGVKVTTTANREELLEVRANAFAAAFLMPRSGVESFIQGRRKGEQSRAEHEVYDQTTEEHGPAVTARKRVRRGSQKITYQDVAMLAQHFTVSYLAAAYRLKNLGVVNRDDLEDLLGKEDIAKEFLKLVHLDEELQGREDERRPDRELVRQVTELALEAYRQEEISSGKLREISKVLGIPARKLVTHAEAAK